MGSVLHWCLSASQTSNTSATRDLFLQDILHKRLLDAMVSGSPKFISRRNIGAETLDAIPEYA